MNTFFKLAGGVSGVVNTGNAAIGDVASGQTFSSSLLTNAIGTSTKNATVPLDAPIQPPQAFVDIGSALIGLLGNNNGPSVSSESLTHLSLRNCFDSVFGTSAFDYVTNIGSGKILNLAGSSLPTEDIDGILSDMAARSPSGFTLNLSGSNMGVPTPASPFAPEIVTLTFPASPSPSITEDGSDVNFFVRNAPSARIWFSITTVLADSEVAFGYYKIGILDSPTATQMATKFAELINDASCVDNLDGTVTITDHEPNDFPYSNFDNGTGVTANETSIGAAFVKNADITTIVSNGGTVTCMEYVNRSSGDKESVTYAP